MRFAPLLAAALLVLVSPAEAGPAEVGVQVEKPAGDGVHFSQGSGVYLGEGLVLTAAHVVAVDPGSNRVTVLLDGVRQDATQVFDGRAEGTDLALLSLPAASLSPARRTQPAVAVCAENPEPSRPVQVAALGTVSVAFTIPSPLNSEGPSDTGRWTNILATGYKAGSSGGGVFDPRQGCLWGILAVELSGPAKSSGRFLDLTAFVPASKIAPFLRAYAESHRQAAE